MYMTTVNRNRLIALILSVDSAPSRALSEKNIANFFLAYPCRRANKLYPQTVLFEQNVKPYNFNNI